MEVRGFCWMAASLACAVLVVGRASADPIEIDLFVNPAVTDGVAIFQDTNVATNGSHAFLTFKTQPSELEGFNTDRTPEYADAAKTIEFDSVDSNSNKTNAIVLGDVPVFTIGTTDYFEFLLDANQTGASPAIYLDDVELYTIDGDSVADPNEIDTLETLRSLGSLAYHMDTTSGLGDLQAIVDGSNGTGKGNMFLYVPVSRFANFGANTYLYLYSKLHGANNGADQWVLSDEQNPSPPADILSLVTVPESTSIALAGLALAGLTGVAVRRRGTRTHG